MSMGTSVVFIRDLENGSEFDKMIRLKLACEEAKIDYPKELVEYFRHRLGAHVAESVDFLRREATEVHVSYTKDPSISDWHDDSGEGFEVEVAKIPEWVKKIRFYNSW